MKMLLLAGEESGVLYARQIADELHRRDPSAEVRTYGDYGFVTADLAVFGIWAVVRKIFYFLRVKRTMERAIVEWRPDVVCTIDYPGMNLKLAAFAKSHGVRAVHVVCPQVWAWHQGRIPKIEASLDRLCCFLPFEPKIFREGLAAFVGHPLVDEIHGDVANAVSLRRRLALLPGSRLGEIAHHLPDLLEAAAHLGDDLEVTIPAASPRARAAIDRIVARATIRPRLLKVVDGGAREVLRQADCAVVASGTATFEAALVGCPFVLVYRVSPLLAAFLRRAITGVKHVGLINVIAEKANAPCPMPELLQEAFTPDAVVALLRPWLEDPAANARARASFAATLSLLKSPGSAISRIVDEIK